MRRVILPIVIGVTAQLAVAQTPQLADGLYAEFKTERGTFVCSLDYQRAPMTVANFVGLAEGTIQANGVKGKKFYDGLTFHRVEPGFVIQGGDPKGDGSGGPGYEFPNETSPLLKHDSAGVLSMANAGPDTNGSQFFVTLAPAPHLDGSYNVFGRVVQGMDVVKAIQKGDHMITVRILRIGSAAGGFAVTQKSFDDLVAKAKADAVQRHAKQRTDALSQIQKKWPKLTTTRSGLMYEVLAKGSGGSPAATATVTVKYTGMLLDGTIFDSTDQHGGSATLQVNRVIPGLVRGAPGHETRREAAARHPSRACLRRPGVPWSDPRKRLPGVRGRAGRLLSERS